jgi:hypothetical protein
MIRTVWKLTGTLALVAKFTRPGLTAKSNYIRYVMRFSMLSAGLLTSCYSKTFLYFRYQSVIEFITSLPKRYAVN